MKNKMFQACLMAASAIVSAARAEAPEGFDPKNMAEGDATFDQVIADMTEEATTIGGIQTFIDALKQQLADALSGVTIPPATQEKINAIFASAEANKAALATALTTNVPPPPGG